METISGIEIYPIISFIIFFAFFILVLVYVFKADKKTMNDMSNLPLDLKDSDHEKV